jgi:hypothetical protein
MSKKFNKAGRLTALLVPAVLALGASVAGASNVGVDVNVHVGNQPQVVVPAPAPVVVPPPAPFISIEQDVDFVYPASLGFYVAVGVPYDLFYVRNNYYLWRDGRWYWARDSHGPWVVTRYRDLPPGLRKHNIERIRAYRSSEYDLYRRDRDHYHGRHFRTGKDEWKEHRKAEKEYRKEEKRAEKEYRKEMKRAEKEDRKAEKEERKQHKHD